MNIVQEKVNDLNSILKVSLGPADYQQLVEKQLKDIQRKASMPGFRPGKVPVGLVKKMYGKSVLADEINKVLNHSVTQYISDNQLEILGQPIPAQNENDIIDWEHQQEFEFSFELGHIPDFQIEVLEEPFEYLIIKTDDALVDKEIEDMQRRYGKVSYPEKAERGDLVFGDFSELDAEGNLLESGIKKTSSIALDKITNEQVLSRFIGLSKGDHLELDPHDLSDNHTDIAAMLGVNSDKVAELNSKFQFKVTNISRMEHAEINEELYHKVYGDSINTIEAFRAKIDDELKAMFNADSDRYFLSKAIAGLVRKYDVQLPEEFLKRWLLVTNEKELTAQQIEHEFPVYAERLRTQIIINKIVKQNNLSVSQEEIQNYVSDLIKKQFESYNHGAEMEAEDLKNTVKRVLSNEKEYNRLVEKLYDDKMLKFLKSKLKLNFTEVSVDQFYKQQ